jgi:hypothetical protein
MPQEKMFFRAPLGLKLPLVYHNWPPRHSWYAATRADSTVTKGLREV